MKNKIKRWKEFVVFLLKRERSLSAYVLLAVFLTGNTWADTNIPVKKGERGEVSKERKMMGKGRKMQNFKRLDTNEDGVLSFEEFALSRRLLGMDKKKQRKIFDYIDRDKSGTIQMRELRGGNVHKVRVLMGQFKKWDKNQSNTLSYQEWSEVPEFSKMKEERRKKFFKLLDINNDNQIQKRELKVYLSKAKRRCRCPMFNFKKYDKDQDGELDYEEYTQMPWMGRIDEKRKKRHFERIDVNGNGKISKEEIRRARLKHQNRKGWRRQKLKCHEKGK